MDKKLSLLLGIGLVLFGGLLLAVNLFGHWVGWGLVWVFDLLWPLPVVCLGLVFVVPPLLSHQRRGLGALFIPGMPVLISGFMLTAANTLNLWWVWKVFWPLEVLALAIGFALAAAWMRVIWLLIPASIIGFNGLVLQFCALTGWWESWAALWAVEPLALGVALLAIGIRRHSPCLSLVGVMLCGFAWVAFTGMLILLLGVWRLFGLFGPVALILTGVALLAWGMAQRSPKRNLAAQQPTAG